MNTLFAFDYASLFAPILEPFRSEIFGPKLAVLLLAVAAVVLVSFLASAMLQVLRLMAALRVIVGKTAGGGNQEKREIFQRDFDKIDRALVSNRAVSGPWQEFRKNFIVREGAHSQLIYSSIPARALFNARSTRVQYDFVRSLPNLFVGLGLLGTFIGLIAALTFSTESLTRAADQEQIKNALSLLLTTAAAKFYISAAGLLSSLLLSLFVRGALKYIHLLVHAINHALEERILYLSQEAISEQQFSVQQQSLEELKLFNTNIAMRVGDAVRSAVEASNETLTRKLSDIADSFNRLVDGSRDTASGVINDAMKGAFDATLRQASDSIGHVAASLKDLPERVSAAAASIQNAGETATKQQAEMAETIKKGIEELLRETTKQVSNDIRSGTQDFVSDLKETGSTFGDSAAKINSFLERFDDNVEGYAKSLASLSEQNGRLESNLSNISERLIAASNSISMAGQNVDGSIQKLLAWNKDFTRVATETFNVSKESQKSIRDTVESLQQQMRTHIQRFDSVDEKLAGVFNSIASHLELQSRQMSEQFTRMDNALGSAVNQFELIIDGLADFTGNRRAAE